MFQIDLRVAQRPAATAAIALRGFYNYPKDAAPKGQRFAADL